MMYQVMPERREGPVDPMPKSPSPSDEGGGPRRPETGSPGERQFDEADAQGRSEAGGTISATDGPVGWSRGELRTRVTRWECREIFFNC